MMRRNSPPRFGRRKSPPRRNRPRSFSPSESGLISIDERGRKHNINSWDASDPPKRIRSRSRDRMVRGSEDHRRNREFSGTSRKGADRLEERRSKDPGFWLDDFKDKKHHFKSETNFVDLPRNINNFEDQNDYMLDPSSINFNSYPENNERAVEPPYPPHIEPYVKHSEKNETSDERIQRLEKLVEKLVESNAKQPKYEESSSSMSRDIPELIPSNTKFTTSAWLNKIHEHCVKKGYDEKTIIQFTQDRMTGIMKAWFKSVSSYEFTWPELKLLITKTFPDNVDFATTLKLLVARDKTSEETITQYYFSKVYLCEACKITGENAVSCLIDGLSNPFMKQDIKSYKFLTPEALYSEYLAKFPTDDMPLKSNQREVIPSYNDEYILPMEDELPVYRPSSSRKERGENKAKCLTCKRVGHSTLQCRHAPICYNCKKKGHIAAKCYADVMFLTSSQEQLPFCKCKINGQVFEAIIDTGAAAVIIQKSVLDQLEVELKPSKVILQAFGGNHINSIGEITITVEIDDVERLVKAFVVEDDVQPYPAIIGQSFLRQKVGTLICDDQTRIFDLPTDLRMKLIK